MVLDPIADYLYSHSVSLENVTTDIEILDTSNCIVSSTNHIAATMHGTSLGQFTRAAATNIVDLQLNSPFTIVFRYY